MPYQHELFVKEFALLHNNRNFPPIQKQRLNYHTLCFVIQTLGMLILVVLVAHTIIHTKTPEFDAFVPIKI